MITPTRLLRFAAVLLVAAIPVTSASGQAAGTTPEAGMTLEEALGLALQNHPRILESRAQEAAASGRALQAGLWANPEMSIGVEQLPTDADAPDTRESVLGLSQRVSPSGKAGKARQAAEFDLEAQTRQMESVRRDVAREVRSAFAIAQFHQQAHEALAQGVLDHSTLAALTQARIGLGESAPYELAAVEMEQVRLVLELEKSQEQARLSMDYLAVAMGMPEREPVSLAGDLEANLELPALEELSRDLEHHPELLRDDAQVKSAHARVKLARAGRIPDLDVELLYRRLNASEENRVDLGLRLPLPIFDRNQGRVAEAVAEASSARERHRRHGMERKTRLAEVHQQVKEALARNRALSDSILPQALEVLQATELRHKTGDLGLVEVLQARNEYMLVRLERLEALRDALVSWGRLSEFVTLE